MGHEMGPNMGPKWVYFVYYNVVAKVIHFLVHFLTHQNGHPEIIQFGQDLTRFGGFGQEGSRPSPGPEAQIHGVGPVGCPGCLEPESGPLQEGVPNGVQNRVPFSVILFREESLKRMSEIDPFPVHFETRNIHKYDKKSQNGVFRPPK